MDPLALARDALVALVATAGFAVLFNVPRRTLPACILIGSLGYVSKRLMLQATPALELATLVAALVVGLLGEAAARWLRAPALIFFVVGFVPLVPGVLSYRTVLLFLEGNYPDGVVSAVRTMFVAGAIAGGLGVVTALFRLGERWTRRSDDQRSG